MMPKMKETKRFNENPACHSDFCGSDTQVCSLSDDLLKRKEENIKAEKHLVGGATC